MNKDENYRDISNIEQDSREGLLFCGWTQKWGLKVYAWYEMDLITFSFIEKGKKGKGRSFDISIPAKKNYYFDFLDFSHEILQDIRTPYDFLKIMEEEKKAGEQYPKRYRFTTGSNGKKMVGICNSTSEGKEYCLNASITREGKTTVVNMPMSYYDIYELADAFSKTYKKRERALLYILESGIQNRDSRIKEAAEQQVTNLAVATTSGIHREENGDYIVEAITQDKTNITIRISQAAIHKINENKENCFELFKERVNKKQTEFRFSGKINKTDQTTEYIFERFENKHK